MASLIFKCVSESPNISVLDSMIKLWIRVCFEYEISSFVLREHILSDSKLGWIFEEEVLIVCKLDELEEDNRLLNWGELRVLLSRGK